MTTFAIACLQLELEHGDNTAAISEEMRRVKARFPWVDMILVGELATFGVGLDRAEAMPGPTENKYCALARELGVWIAPGTLYERRQDKIFNTAPVIDPTGEVIARCRKIYPFRPYERGVEAGGEFTVFDVPNVGRIGVSICYDMWFPETTRTLAWMGAEIILHPSMTNTIDREVELSIARANAAMNQCYFLDVNVSGRLGVGRSIIAGPGGEIVHQADVGREIMPVVLDLDYVRRVREQGWQGLGQCLKSFREGPATFPPYDARVRSEALARLGPLERPQSTTSGETTNAATDRVKKG